MSPSFFFFLTGRRHVGGATSLPKLHVVGREEAVSASAHTSPPALVDHLNVGDDVVRIEGDLVVTGLNSERQISDEGVYS